MGRQQHASTRITSQQQEGTPQAPACTEAPRSAADLSPDTGRDSRWLWVPAPLLE